MKLRNLAVAAATAALLLVGVVPASAGVSTNNGVSELCPNGVNGWSAKVNFDGDGPDKYDYTAPAGYVVIDTCVKAGTTTFYKSYDPGKSTVTLDHPDKDSISHYSVKLEKKVVEPTVVEPKEPKFYDPCGVDNAYWTVPDSTDAYTYSESTWEGYLVVKVVAKDGYVFPGGKTELKWKDKDSGELCPPEVVEPELPTWTDKCGPDNASWDLPQDTAMYSYSTYTDGDYVVAKVVAKDGYVFPGGKTVMTWKDVDSNEPCPRVEVNPDPPVWTDECGPGNAYWTVPGDTEGYTYTESTWQGYLVVKVTAAEGYVFPGGKTELKWKAMDSNEPCPLEEVKPAEPSWVDECGPDNAEWILPPDTEAYSYTTYSYGDYLVVKVTANEGYVFPYGKTEIKWKAMDSNEPCPLEEVKPAEPIWTDMCGPYNAYWTVPEDTEYYHYEESSYRGYKIVKVYAHEGYTFPGGVTEIKWKNKDSMEPCPLVEVQPEPPVWTDMCGPDNAYWTVPDDTEAYTYKTGTWHGYLVVKVYANEGYVFPEGQTEMKWKDKDSNEPCPPEVVEAEEPTWIDACGPDNGYWVLPANTETHEYGVVLNDDDSQTAMAIAKDGYEFGEGVTVLKWTEEDSNEPCPVDASLDGSIVGEVCTAKAPYLGYDIVLTDPDETVEDPTMATITFIHPTDPELNWVREVPVGKGKVLWPGVKVDDKGVAINWPGFKYDKAEDEWVSVGSKNYGWTRMPDTMVEIEVGPTMTFTVDYPEASPTCNASAPEEITAVLNAPPATAVVSDATYTG